METNVDFNNYYKLQFLINKTTILLRHIFMKRWKQMNGNEWINSPEYGNEFINGKGCKTYQKVGNIQRRCLESGDLNKCDLNLIANMLRTVEFSIPGPQNEEFQKEIKKENDKIKRLTEIRNKWAHNPNMKINDDEFSELWNETVLILVSFGESEEELELMKASSTVDQINKTEISEENRAKAKQLKEIGNVFFKNKKFTEAIDKYTEALALSGISSQDMAILYSNRSIAYLSLNKNEIGVKSVSINITTDHSDFRYLALLDAKQSLELSPFWWRAYYRIGCAYQALNKYSKAIHHFDRALAIEPTNEEIKTLRDSCRLKLGREMRFEHLDKRFYPQSTAECLEKLNETGFNITADMFEEMEKMLIEENDPAADVIRAHRYRDGIDGVKQDYEMAAKYYGKAANRGNAEAIYNLALLTNRGLGVELDHKLAIKLLEKAAKEPPKIHNLANIGVMEAQHTLGLYYEEGVGVSKDPVMAMYWYLKASENGSANSANNIGLMYMNGKGVEVDLIKAEQYLNLAASRRDPNAMENLAYYYLRTGDIETARIWYKIAIENGNRHAELFEQDFEESAADIEKDKNLQLISKFESENGLNSDGLTVKKRLERLMTYNAPHGVKEVMEDLFEFVSNRKSAKLPIELSDKFIKYDYLKIDEYAKKGSLTAQKMRIASNYFGAAMHTLLKIQESKVKSEEMSNNFVQQFANCVRIEEIVASIPMTCKEKAMELVNEVLKKESTSKSQLDIDARICYTSLHSNSLDETIDFLKECQKKYPDESFFYRVCGCLYGFNQNYSKGLIELNKALNLSPGDFEIMYSRAAMMRLDKKSDVNDKIDAYLGFLDVAPKDHRKVPESYYAIATLFFEKDGNNTKTKVNKEKGLSKYIPEVKVYYEKGLEAEKIQLPFFLPYQSNYKSMLELFIKMPDSKPDVKLESNSIENSLNKEPKRTFNNEKLTDPSRIELIRGHREYYSQVRGIMSKPDSCKFNTTYPALNKQKAPKSIVGLKPINLKKMDPTKDHIYEGYVMQITFIEDAITGTSSIVTLIEDENGDTQRCFIYNFEHENNDSIVQKTYGFGCKMSLINPYMRMARDRKPAIRVDDPQSLIKIGIDSNVENMCRYCLKASAKSACGRCKKHVIAIVIVN